MDIQQLAFISGLGLIVLGIFWALHQTRVKLRETSIELAEIRNLLVAIKSTGIGQGKKIININSELKNLKSKQQLRQLQDVSEKGFQQASKMLSMGVDAEEVMECCSLTRGEIQLLTQLQHVPAAIAH